MDAPRVCKQVLPRSAHGCSLVHSRCSLDVCLGLPGYVNDSPQGIHRCIAVCADVHVCVLPTVCVGVRMCLHRAVAGKLLRAQYPQGFRV